MPPSITTDNRRESRLLRSRIPRKFLILDDYDRQRTENFQCPLRKGIIYYSRRSVIFEHSIYSPSKREPRIVAHFPLKSIHYHLSFDLIPIKRDRVLLVWRSHAKFSFPVDSSTDSSTNSIAGFRNGPCDLHLSIHEIHFYRVGPALWTYHEVDSKVCDLQLMKSTTNALGITIGVESASHMGLFDVSTEEHYPLIKAGQLNYDRELCGDAVLSPDRHILLNADVDKARINIFCSSSGDANDMDFSFVSHLPILTDLSHANRQGLWAPLVAFSADGSKFATARGDGIVSVWDVRSKTPLKVFVVGSPELNVEGSCQPISFFQFSSGISGKEVLVFMEDDVITCDSKTIQLIDATSFEMEETFLLPMGSPYFLIGLFFDPSGRSMYVELDGTLYEWDLQKNEGPKCEWWLGEE